MSASDVAASASEPRKPNPEVVAWYVEEAQRLLEDRQRRVESLQTRGGQIAGFAAAVLALIGGNIVTPLDALEGLPTQSSPSVMLEHWNDGRMG